MRDMREQQLIFRQFGVILLLLVGLFCTAAAHAATSSTKIVVNVPALKLQVYQGQQLLKTYPVGVGTENFPTPEGEFEVISKVIDPAWENPFGNPKKKNPTVKTGNRSPLGTRWIGFYEANGGEYGIHGTNQPASVGKFSSHGCIRMHIKDAEELFELVDFNTPVEIAYDLVEIEKSDNDEIQVTVYPDVFGRGKPSLGQIGGKIKSMFPGASINEATLAKALKRPAQNPAMVAKDIPSSTEDDDAIQMFKIRITN